MRTVKILAAVAAASALSSAAFGASVVVNGSSGVIQTDFPGGTVVNVPGFTAASVRDCLTTPVLTGTSVKLTANLSSQGSLSNPAQNTSTATVDVTVSGPFTLTLPGGAGTLVATPSITFGPFTLAPGNVQALGPLGNAQSATKSGGTVGWGSPTVALPISTLVKADINGVGGGNLSLALQTFGQATVEVTYDYNCPLIPEPKVYGAVGALLSLGLLGYRQYRAKKA